MGVPPPQLLPPPQPPQQRMESVEHGLAKLAEIRECVDTIALDGAKFFDKGNKAAGVRARKALQDLKTLAQELRIAIQRCKSEAQVLRQKYVPEWNDNVDIGLS